MLDFLGGKAFQGRDFQRLRIGEISISEFGNLRDW